MTTTKVILAGGAGLVGQNLVARLKQRGYRNLVVLDKSSANLQILNTLHADLVAVHADLAEEGPWEHYFEGTDVVVMLQAQIGALTQEPFVRNNIVATEKILRLIRRYRVPYTVHISSSVVNSVAQDHYTLTKRKQEQLVLNSGINCVVLRPTLMFGWFDRKHLGWLSRFMSRALIFPIPGHGRYMRQPLYVGDFCQVIISCIESRISGRAFDITGREKVDYIDMIRQIKRATRSRCLIVKIPFSLFAAMLRAWALVDSNPAFTADQLTALAAGDEFDVIDWEGTFGVKATSFAAAVEETFNHPKYSHMVLEF